MQLTLNIETHNRENNALSQAHLEQHRDKFSKDCFEVLKELVNGQRLTVKDAVLSGLSNSLPRRILDLKKYGIHISDEWASEGRYKEYFLTEADKARVLEVIINKLKAA